jgi:hypothetical protein
MPRILLTMHCVAKVGCFALRAELDFCRKRIQTLSSRDMHPNSLPQAPGRATLPPASINVYEFEVK